MAKKQTETEGKKMPAIAEETELMLFPARTAIGGTQAIPG
jgi:hypothetical protein